MARVQIGECGEPHEAELNVTFLDFPYPTFPADVQITCDSAAEPGRQITLTLKPDEALQFFADLIARLAERIKAAPHLKYPASPQSSAHPLPR
jgi:hypothetical protein